MPVNQDDAERLYRSIWQSLNSIAAAQGVPKDKRDAAKCSRDKINQDYRDFWKKANEERTQAFLAFTQFISGETEELSKGVGPVAALQTLQGSLNEAVGLLTALGLWKEPAQG